MAVYLLVGVPTCTDSQDTDVAWAALRMPSKYANYKLRGMNEEGGESEGL